MRMCHNYDTPQEGEDNCIFLKNMKDNLTSKREARKNVFISIKGVIQKTKTGKIASKKHNGVVGGVSDAKKTQLFPQKVILLATI